MFFQLKELVKWFGMTVFEIWLNLVTILIFSVLAVLKYEGVIKANWWYVFIPLFTCDGLCTYFCWIVFIRMYKEKEYRAAALRLVSSMVCITLLFVFKVVFCKKLNDENNLSYSEVFSPVFIVLTMMVIKACQIH